MSEDFTEQDNVLSEKETIKNRLDRMGIGYHPNTGLDKLKSKLKIALNDNLPSEQEELMLTKTDTKLDKIIDSPATIRAKIFAKKKKEANKLVRVRINCMNPNKKKFPGEIFSVGSAKVGTFKKFVPFNNTITHIPNIIYQFLNEKKCALFYEVKTPKGMIKKSKLINEFAIEVLPALTKKEMEDLAKRQAMSGTIYQE